MPDRQPVQPVQDGERSVVRTRCDEIAEEQGPHGRRRPTEERLPFVGTRKAPLEQLANHPERKPCLQL